MKDFERLRKTLRACISLDMSVFKMSEVIQKRSWPHLTLRELFESSLRALCLFLLLLCESSQEVHALRASIHVKDGHAFTWPPRSRMSSAAWKYSKTLRSLYLAKSIDSLLFLH